MNLKTAWQWLTEGEWPTELDDILDSRFEQLKREPELLFLKGIRDGTIDPDELVEQERETQ